MERTLDHLAKLKLKLDTWYMVEHSVCVTQFGVLYFCVSLYSTLQLWYFLCGFVSMRMCLSVKRAKEYDGSY